MFFGRKNQPTAPPAPAQAPAAPVAAQPVPEPASAPAEMSPQAAPAAPADAASAVSPEEAKRRTAMSRQVSAAFGDIVSVLMRSPGFKAMPLGELETFVVPAVATGQFSVAQAQLKTNGAVAPVGIVLWASVSPEIDQRLAAAPDKAIRLQPAEWRSGDIIWIVEAAGDRRVIAAQLKRLTSAEWSGKVVKLRVKGPDGKPAVRILEAQQTAA